MSSSTPILSAAYDQLKDESHELLKKKKGLGKAIDTVADVVKAPGGIKKELKKLKYVHSLVQLTVKGPKVGGPGFLLCGK